jgi:hypothetical protein
MSRKILNICIIALLVSCLIFVQLPKAQDTLNSGLVLYLPLNESLADRSDLHNNAVNEGAVWVDGLFGHGLQFDGTTDALVPHAISLTFTTQDFTIAFWVKLDSFGNHVYMAKGSWQSDGWYIKEGDNNRITLTFNVGGQNPCVESQDNTMIVGEWVYLVFVRFGSFIHIYSNGIEKTGTGNEIGIIPGSNTRNLYIGAYQSAGSDGMHGTMDEVRVYDRALSSSEVRALYDLDPEAPVSTEQPNQFRVVLEDVVFGDLWFMGFLVIAAICILLVRFERYSAIVVIPCLLVLEGLYFTHNDSAGSLIWAMIASLLLIFFVATMSIFEKGK